MANNHCTVIKQKKQQKGPTFGQTKPSLHVGSVSVEGLFCESEAHRRRQVDFCPLARERVLRPKPRGDRRGWAVLVALHDPESPTQRLSCPILLRFGEGRVGQ